MKHDYEVRLLLGSTAVLSSNNKLIEIVLSTFKMPPTTTKLNVQFLDKGSLDLYATSWSAHIRKIKNKKDLELTYKKRYTIWESDNNAVFNLANNDGSNTDKKTYEAQVE
ncbi:hypothetical protein BDV27DRAFT_155934 [Aspergillus caelatus]|uniref:Uncharacterized protein n=1 Tax=Aspergillus caelatus TaxID=61420 RepID=A0A5N7A9D6_9EURO|nr:uncharacterized protein BDV27DRAFT_155934 [Aspergillus caelatus]KAE8366442.1 hypothetical protein BDV27DRAFT_155934 [Aspergillus caelatus]